MITLCSLLLLAAPTLATHTDLFIEIYGLALVHAQYLNSEPRQMRKIYRCLLAGPLGAFVLERAEHPGDTSFGGHVGHAASGWRVMKIGCPNGVTHAGDDHMIHPDFPATSEGCASLARSANAAQDGVFHKLKGCCAAQEKQQEGAPPHASSHDAAHSLPLVPASPVTKHGVVNGEQPHSVPPHSMAPASSVTNHVGISGDVNGGQPHSVPPHSMAPASPVTNEVTTTVVSEKKPESIAAHDASADLQKSCNTKINGVPLHYTFDSSSFEFDQEIGNLILLHSPKLHEEEYTCKSIEPLIHRAPLSSVIYLLSRGFITIANQEENPVCEYRACRGRDCMLQSPAPTALTSDHGDIESVVFKWSKRPDESRSKLKALAHSEPPLEVWQVESPQPCPAGYQVDNAYMQQLSDGLMREVKDGEDVLSTCWRTLGVQLDEGRGLCRPVRKEGHVEDGAIALDANANSESPEDLTAVDSETE